MKKILSISLMFLGGCMISEPRNERCSFSVDIELRYTVAESDDVLADNIGDIHLYVFDSRTGKLADIMEIGYDDIAEGRIFANLPAGVYDFTAWGGGCSDLYSGGFGANGFMNASNFRMVLDAAHATDFSDLFFASAFGVEIKNKGAHIVPFDFVRNSNVLRVSVEGVDHIVPPTRAAESPLDIYVRGRNATFTFDGGLCPYGQMVCYRPVPHTVSVESVKSDIKILRLDISAHTGEENEKVELIVERKSTGAVLARIDVMEAILRMTDAEGKPLYASQKDIDDAEAFDLEISFEPDPVSGSIRIALDDWVIGYYRPILNEL